MSAADSYEARYELDPAASAARRTGSSWWRNPWWPTFALAAFIVYEITAQPLLASLVLCLKLGLDYFRTGFWLMRRDPEFGRGGVHALACSAMGCWRVAIVGFAVTIGACMMLAIADDIARGGRNGAGPQVKAPPPFVVGALALQSALLLGATVFLTGLAWLAALLTKTKVWVNGGLHDCRRRDSFPPRPSGPNRLRTLLFTAVILGATLSVAVVLIVLTAKMGWGVGRPPGARPGAGAGLAVYLVMGAMLVGIAVAMSFLERVAARSPHEAWPATSPRRERLAEP
ncbi:MAG TPA: hypothetical protein VNC50_02355 [Planctomycetia bacterium]|nr:hypothetical protein [Planctomycetia bacterium]